MRRLIRPAGLVVAAMLSSSCVSSGMQTEISQVVAVPETFASPPSGESLNAWCSDFGDPELDLLVEQSLNDNLSLRAAWARIEQLEAVARATGSTRYPRLDLQVDGGRSRTASAFGPTEQNRFALSLPAAYEIDLWGRADNSVKAAERDVDAIRDDMEAIAMSLSAQVAEAWFDSIHQRARLDLINEQVETNELFRELIFMRMGQGQASAPDIYQQQARIDAGLAQLTLVEARLQTAQNQLAVLVGQTPQTRLIGDRRGLPPLPSPLSVGIPADLLDLRPDVRSARHRVESADHRVAVAIANRLPGIRLTGSLSLGADSPAELLEEIFWSLGASVAGTLFDGGSGAAEVDRTRAVVDERLYTYGQTLLTAILEVENALVLEEQQGRYIEGLNRQLETSRASLQVERERYLDGVTDYLRVLTALQSTQTIEQQVLDAERQLLSYRVQLCRSVGGDWTTALEDPRPAHDSSNEDEE